MRHLPIARTVALATLLCAACSQNLVQTPSRNLDRPTDVAFVCMDLDGGVPTPVAESRCAVDPDAGLPTATLYGFVTNTARGEVALVDLGQDTTIHLVDLDPREPGYGFLPVGKLPSRISASSDGCRMATANTGTCDVSIIDTGAAIGLRSSGTATVGDGGLTVPRGTVARLQPRTADGLLLAARPREIAFVPASAPATCPVDAVYQVIVTFPRCGLVALVEVPSGRILDSMKLTAAGLVPAGTSPWCPSECGAEKAAPQEDGGQSDAAADAPQSDAAPDAADSDAGQSDGGVQEDAGAQDDGGTPAGPAPMAGGLALSPDGARVYVASDDQPLVYAASLVDGHLAALRAVRLDSTAAGVRRLRLSPPFEFGTLTQSFLYAFSGDRSVHVVLAQQTADGATTDEMVECDTNPDPRRWVDRLGSPSAGAAGIRKEARGCVRLDQGIPRRPQSTTPGITLAAGVPKDVAFLAPTAYQVSRRTDTEHKPTNLVGTFGWLATSRGNVAILNVLPDLEAGEAGWGASNTAYPSETKADPSLVMAHRVRNIDDITLGVTNDSVAAMAQNEGPPRAYAMSRLADGVAYTRPDVFRIDDAHKGGSIVADVGLVFDTYKSLYDVAFPDVAATQDEGWSFTFRGTLPGSLRATGNLDAAGGAVDDRSQPFCELGTRPGDLFAVGGCILDSQCAVGEVCVTDPVAPPSVTGLCFPKELAEDKQTECFGFLSTLRYYRVTKAYSDRLLLAPSYEVRNLPGGCDPSLGTTEDDRCNAAAPTDMPEPDPSTKHYRCESVPWPSAGAGECVRDCAGGRACGEGYACDGARCVAGPTITPEATQSCLGELVNYYLQAGDGFLVFGNFQGAAVTGFLHRVVRSGAPDATGHYECIDKLDLTTDPAERARLALYQGRIPLLPPKCTVDPLVTWPPDPNPCRVEGVAEEYKLPEGGTANDGRAVKVYFANPVINVGFFIGQLDEAGNLVVNPPPSSNYSVQVDVAGWYQPYGVTVSSYLPETIVTGPDNYIYIVDSGLDVSTSGLRGQLLRIDPATGGLDTNFVVR